MIFDKTRRALWSSLKICNNIIKKFFHYDISIF